MAQASFAHAAQALRKDDRDRYLSSLVLTGDHRDAVMALYAFNADVASIRSRISDPVPGEIRLQWWNDALEGKGHGAVRQNPVADALLDTMARYTIPAGTLLRLIAARRFDLYDDPMPDLESFEGYAGETVSTLYQLAAMILNDGETIETGDAAGHLGVAHAMIGHLRSFGYVSSQGRIVLPWSIMAANGVREDDIFSGAASDGVVEALGQISDLAAEHLDKAGTAIARLPGRLTPAFAHIALLDMQLARYRRRSSGPFSVASDEADWRKIARLAWWNWRNR